MSVTLTFDLKLLSLQFEMTCLQSVISCIFSCSAKFTGQYLRGKEVSSKLHGRYAPLGRQESSGLCGQVRPESSPFRDAVISPADMKMKFCSTTRMHLHWRADHMQTFGRAPIFLVPVVCCLLLVVALIL